MNRSLIRFTIFFVTLLILISLEIKALANQNETEDKIVGNLPEVNVTLYAIERDGYLENFKLKSNGGIQYYPSWINVSNEAYKPQLFYNDINSDGKKELIIILTTGYGTGIIEQNIYVLHKTKTDIGEVYKEIIVDNPMTILLKNVKTKLTKSKAIINIGNEQTIINIDELDIDPKNLFSDIVTGNIVKFNVLNDKLTAIIGAQVSPVGGYIGSFYITYTFKDGMYQLKRIKFIQD